MPCIFCLFKLMKNNNLRETFFMPSDNMAQALRFARYKTGPQPYAACRVTNALLGFQTLFIQ